MFPFDPPPPTILPYFINTNRLIVSSCVFSCIMTLEPVHKLVTGVILSVAIPSPQFGLVCCAGLCIIANTMPCGSNEILPYGKDCHFFCEYWINSKVQWWHTKGNVLRRNSMNCNRLMNMNPFKKYFHCVVQWVLLSGDCFTVLIQLSSVAGTVVVDVLTTSSSWLGCCQCRVLVYVYWFLCCNIILPIHLSVSDVAFSHEVFQQKLCMHL